MAAAWARHTGLPSWTTQFHQPRLFCGEHPGEGGSKDCFRFDGRPDVLSVGDETAAFMGGYHAIAKQPADIARVVRQHRYHRNHHPFDGSRQLTDSCSRIEKGRYTLIIGPKCLGCPDPAAHPLECRAST